MSSAAIAERSPTVKPAMHRSFGKRADVCKDIGEAHWTSRNVGGGRVVRRNLQEFNDFRLLKAESGRERRAQSERPAGEQQVWTAG